MSHSLWIDHWSEEPRAWVLHWAPHLPGPALATATNHRVVHDRKQVPHCVETRLVVSTSRWTSERIYVTRMFASVCVDLVRRKTHASHDLSREGGTGTRRRWRYFYWSQLVFYLSHQPLHVNTIACHHAMNFFETETTSDATGLNRFNIKFFRLQHQISSINIKERQDLSKFLHITYNYRKTHDFPWF